MPKISARVHGDNLSESNYNITNHTMAILEQKVICALGVKASVHTTGIEEVLKSQFDLMVKSPD